MSQNQNRPEENMENEDLQKIDLLTLCVDFLRVFRKMWLHVLVLAIVGAAVSGVRANGNYVPYYTASCTFTITIREEQNNGSVTTSSSFFDNSAAEQMAITFPHILTSGVLQRRAAAEMGMSYVPGSIQASVVKDTNLFTISVKDTDPERANATLQAVINNYRSISESIVGKVNMNMLDETGVPTQPDNPKNIKNEVMKGAIAGGGFGFVWAALVASFRKTVRREEDCPRYVNQRCLGSVPFVHFKERSKKVERYLNILNEYVGFDFEEAIRIIRNKIERSAKENTIKVILVTSALAGEGKSTIAVNLALSMAKEGKRVALVDCDLRNPSDSAILGIEAEKGLIDFLKKDIPFQECVYSGEVAGISDRTKFLFLPGGKAVADGANLLGTVRMKKVVDSLKEHMDYVILDSAPVGLLTDASVLAQYAEGAVFIIKKDFAKADHILNGMEHLAESNIHMMGCVLNGD